MRPTRKRGEKIVRAEQKISLLERGNPRAANAMRKTAETKRASSWRHRLSKWIAGHHLRIELAETATLALPIALTQLGQIAMMATDLAYIGRIGTEAVAAAALAGMVLSAGLTFGAG